MRVTFVLPAFFDYPIGGYRVVYEYANYLATKGHSVCVVYLVEERGDYGFVQRAKGAARELRRKLARTPRVSWMALDPSVRLVWQPPVAASLPDGDAIIATAWQTARLVASALPASGKGFYLVQDHEVWRNVKEERVNATFRLGLHVIAISTWLAELAEVEGSARTSLVLNGLDHAAFKVTSSVLSRPLRALALFHDDPRKDTASTIDAFKEARRLVPALAFRMFGVPARHERLPVWIEYFQQPTPDTLLRLYNQSAIFVSSSLLEGWCLPAAEAMACGCALVCTDSKGPRDFAIDGVSALFSSPGDVQALADNITRVATDASLRHALQDSGIQSTDRLTWEKSGEALVRLLSE